MLSKKAERLLNKIDDKIAKGLPLTLKEWQTSQLGNTYSGFWNEFFPKFLERNNISAAARSIVVWRSLWDTAQIEYQEQLKTIVREDGRPTLRIGNRKILYLL